MKCGKTALSPVPMTIGRKECNSSGFIVQKLDYMHNNPFTGKWQLALNAIDYPHSSAKFYIFGQQGIYPVLNYRELDDMNLNME